MREMRVKSTSKNELTCAEVWRDITMCSLISCRIFDMGSTRSPGHGSGSGPACTAGCPPAARAGAFGPDSRYSSSSRLVTRPETPLPCNALNSTPWSAAMRRTRGEDLVRRRSSSDEVPLPCADGVAGALDWCEAGGAGGVFSLRGGAPAPPLALGAPLAGAAVAAALAATGAGAGVAAPTPAATSVSNRATTVCTGTVWPSVTRISAITPVDGAGISASTLSVEISNIGSSRFTVSPIFFNHFDSVPSAIDSPIWGMTTSMRATASPSFRVLCVAGDVGHRSTTSCATKRPDRHYREYERSNDRAEDGVREPIARRARLCIRRTLARRSDDLRDQHRDHSAAREPSGGGQTTHTKIVARPSGRRVALSSRHRQ